MTLPTKEYHSDTGKGPFSETESLHYLPTQRTQERRTVGPEPSKENRSFGCGTVVTLSKGCDYGPVTTTGLSGRRTRVEVAHWEI